MSLCVFMSLSVSDPPACVTTWLFLASNCLHFLLCIFTALLPYVPHQIALFHVFHFPAIILLSWSPVHQPWTDSDSLRSTKSRTISVAIYFDPSSTPSKIREVLKGFGRLSLYSGPVSETATLPQTNAEEPMQMGWTRLTQEEHQQCLWEGHCIHYGQMGHFLSTCPVKGKAHQWRRGYWWAKPMLITIALILEPLFIWLLLENPGVWDFFWMLTLWTHC